MPQLTENFLGSDLACVTVSSFNPLTATATVAQPFTFDVVVDGATITSIGVLPGDGQPVQAAALVSGDEWGVTLTYPTAGAYEVEIQVLDSLTETHSRFVSIVVS